LGHELPACWCWWRICREINVFCWPQSLDNLCQFNYNYIVYVHMMGPTEQVTSTLLPEDKSGSSFQNFVFFWIPDDGRSPKPQLNPLESQFVLDCSIFHAWSSMKTLSCYSPFSDQWFLHETHFSAEQL
jgi:hypothetical protein